MIPLNNLIHGLIENLAGNDVVPLIDLLWNKENVSEFKLADKLEITVNLVRNMLYKLHSKSLVEFMRKKDKRKGWYIYYWTFNLKKALELLILMKGNRIKFLGSKLSQREVEEYFTCPGKCVIFKYGPAMESEFKCPECGSILTRLDVKRQVSQLKRQIKILHVELKDSKEYLKDEIERIEKKKLRAERRALKKRTKKTKKKVKKKSKKKKVKKKKPKKKVKKKVKKKSKKKKVKKNKHKRKVKKKVKKKSKKKKVKKKKPKRKVKKKVKKKIRKKRK